MNRFLAVVPAWEAAGAFILAAEGKEASAVLNAALLPGAPPAPFGSPEGAGLWVSSGDLRRGNVADGESIFVWDLQWRRATAEDLESFGMPLGERVEAVAARGTETADGFCCAMRRRFLIGIAAVNTSVPDPIDLVDHVLHFGGEGRPTVMAFAFCPFCGAKRDNSAMLRVLQRGEGS